MLNPAAKGSVSSNPKEVRVVYGTKSGIFHPTSPKSVVLAHESLLFLPTCLTTIVHGNQPLAKQCLEDCPVLNKYFGWMIGQGLPFLDPEIGGCSIAQSYSNRFLKRSVARSRSS